MDNKKALKYYTSEQELAEAQFVLGYMYYQGNGVERDLGEARRLSELAAAQGSQESLSALDILLRS